jgi:predicted flap endonuclease-1-like 5' DNA nuclease
MELSMVIGIEINEAAIFIVALGFIFVIAVIHMHNQRLKKPVATSNEASPIQEQAAPQESILKQKVEPRTSSRVHTTTLTSIKGIGPKTSEKLKATGITTVDELLQQTPLDLSTKIGVSEKVATSWINSADEMLTQ